MATYSTNLALTLINTGDQAGTWGVTTNTNLGTLLEQAVSGYVTQAITDGADTTITIPNGATGVARNMYIECTGTLSADRNLVVPTNKKLYFIYNNTSGGFAVTVKVSGGTGVSVPNGEKKVLVSNGTDIIEALTPQVPASLTVTTLNATSATITDATIGDLIVDSATITTSGTNQSFSINPNGTGQVIIGSATDTGFAANGTALEVIADPSGVLYPLLCQSQNELRACLLAWNTVTSGDNVFINFITEATPTGRGSVTYNRGAGQVAYNTTSDRRAKIIEGPVTNSGQVVDALNVYTGRMIWADINMPMMIADEAMQVTPYCVTGEPNAVDEKGNPIYQQMDYSALVPLLLAEIQSLRSRVAALEGP